MEGFQRLAGHKWPTASTPVYAVIGDPISHSFSPTLLNEAFEHTGIDAVFVALRVREEDLGDALRGVRSLGIRGLSVTMPHKATIIPFLDDVTVRSRRLESVNCVYWDGSRLMGDSTDGPALADALERDYGESIKGSCVAIAGTGGAARAICMALADAGVSKIVVIGRRREAVDAILALVGPVARPGEISDAAEADIVVNATNIGMAETAGAGLSIFPRSSLRPTQLVCDIVYYPVMTPLLLDAVAVGARISNGTSMLALQAAAAFTNWMGRQAPRDIMLHTAERLASGRRF